MLLKTQRGQIRLPNNPFAKGGEGCVYEVIGRPDSVVKLYYEKGRTAEKERKLRAMLASPPAGDVRGQVAWPTDIVYDSAGRFAGFLMPRIRNTAKIDGLYSYDKRGDHAYGFYVQVALNLCAAVEAVHKSGHICGDLNPANICVDPDTGLVTLVDTDSYHIRGAGGELFRCAVCRPEYVPAEIHRLLEAGEDLRTTQRATFTAETDYFALAVHIFALLMNGCHPFACVPPAGVSGSRFTLTRNITAGAFPFLAEERPLHAPKYAPFLGDFPKLIGGLFTVAFWSKRFGPEKRPTPAEWYAALGDLEQNLVQCPEKNAHQYWNGAQQCPLCFAEQETRQVLDAAPSRLSQTPPSVAKAEAKPARPHQAFSGVRFGYLLGLSAGAVIWVLAQLLLFWALGSIPLFTWWWALSRYFLTGVCAYIPLWVGALVDELFCFTISDFGEGVATTLNATRYLAVVVLSLGIAVFTWGSWLNMVLSAFVACLPVILLHKLLPDFTEDIILV